MAGKVFISYVLNKFILFVFKSNSCVLSNFNKYEEFFNKYQGTAREEEEGGGRVKGGKQMEEREHIILKKIIFLI